jgi:hypothetical protein
MTARIALLALVFATACRTATPPPLRGTEVLAAPIALEALETRADVPDANGNPTCSDLLFRRTSIERFVDRNDREFNLGVIELSDDGHVSDDVQRDMVFARLREVALGGKGKSIDLKKSPGAIVIVFVHGWHHRSKVCDNNLACFRRVLQALSEAQADKHRPVFGVYVGWRGDTFEKRASFLSFYDRKATAHHIGQEAGREILLDLNDTYQELNDRIDNGMTHPVTMVTAGHSFGGALVYSAVEGALVRELRNMTPKTGQTRPVGSVHVVGRRAVDCAGSKVRPIRPGIGDLVVLVNPAFEARRYREFVNDESTDGDYADGQLPVLLTVASEGDSAVKVAFPIGRSLYFSVFPWRYRGLDDIIGAGHYDPQTTHNLVVTDNAGKRIRPAAAERPPKVVADEATRVRCDLHTDRGDLATCKCEYDVPDLLATVARGTELTLASGSVAMSAADEKIDLQPRNKARDPRSPFIVARVAPEIISQHSDIYTPRFITFLTAYIGEFLQRAKDVEPGSRDEPSSPCVP